jgi:integrase
MNLENLRNKYPQLLSDMEKIGYSKIYIKGIHKSIQWIIAESEHHNWVDYHDVCKYYEQTSNTHNNYKRKRAYLGVIMEFDLHGKLPDGKDSMLIKKGSYTKLKPTFKALVDHFCQNELGRGVEKTTINVWKNEASCFLYFLQEAGIYRLADAKEEAVLPFFISSDMKPIKGSSYRWAVSRFLQTCTPIDTEGCKKVLSFIPMLRRARKNVQYLTSDEHRKIVDALGDISNALTLRERAIGQIAVRYGMRSGDIAALELNSIDWDRDIIRIIQRKTQQPLELPLLTEVGNAIYDYISHERPANSCPSLFLTQNAPFGQISGEGAWRASESIMNMVGIRQEKGDRKGFHISRHHLVTTLMGKGIQQPIISAIVGHINPKSIETYSYANHVNLKGCALSIERFPVSLEVLPDA